MFRRAPWGRYRTRQITLRPWRLFAVPAEFRSTVGNRIRLSIECPPCDLVEKFRKTSPPDLTDAMNESGAMRQIVPMYSPMTIQTLCDELHAQG
jgi:hypothetical protein